MQSVRIFSPLRRCVRQILPSGLRRQFFVHGPFLVKKSHGANLSFDIVVAYSSIHAVSNRSNPIAFGEGCVSST